MALGLDDPVVRVSSNVQTLLEKLQREVELILVQVLVSDELVNAHQVLRDNLLDLVLLAVLCLLESRFQMVHSLELVVDLLLADTETAMRLSLSLDVLKLDGDVEAPLVEVRSRFVIAVPSELLRHLLVHNETVARLLVPPVELTLHECVTDARQVVWGLFGLNLDFLVELLLLLESITWLDSRGSRPVGQVEEVDVRLHKTFGQQSDSDVHFVHFLLELEAAVLLLHVVHDTASDADFLRLLASGAVLLKDLGLGGSDQLVLLLSLRLLDDLADAGVRVHDRLMFHTSLPA